MIRELERYHADSVLLPMSEYVNRAKPIYSKPSIGEAYLCGAIRGLDVKVKSLVGLAKFFCDGEVFVLSQNLDDISRYQLIKFSASQDGGELSAIINSDFPEIFSGDLVILWGDSHKWYILFDPQLAFGLLIVRKASYVDVAVRAFSQGGVLLNVQDAISECRLYEAFSMSEYLGFDVGEALFRSWQA